MRAVEEKNTIEISRRGLVGLYVLYQLTWTIAMFYAYVKREGGDMRQRVQ